MAKKFLNYDTFKQQCIKEGENIFVECLVDGTLPDADYSPVIKLGIDNAIKTLENDGYATELIKSLAAEIHDLESLVWFQEDILSLVEMGLM